MTTTILFFLSVKLTKCQEQVQQIVKLSEQAGFMIGAFLPRCKPDGSYEPKQCHGSAGYCWCVDSEGKEIKGTRMGAPAEEEDLICPPGMADLCNCASLRAVFSKYRILFSKSSLQL